MSHQPQRTCVGCGGKRPPDEMLRIAARNGEAPQIDAGKQKASGRGAYLCKAADCARKAWKRRAVERALKLKVPLDAAFKARVEAALETAISTQINSQESQYMN